MLLKINLPELYSRAGKLAVMITAACIIAACATDARVDKANENFVEVHSGKFDHVFMERGSSLPRLSRVSIADPAVEFSRQWLRDHRGDYTDGDLARIRKDYGRFLKEALAEAMEKAGVEVVASAQEADMLLRPSLLNLNIYAPDLTHLPARTDQYVEQAGNATFNLELVDPQSREATAQFVDHRETPAIVTGRLEETNRATNNRLFRRLMERWSNNFIEYLELEGAVDRR